MKQLQGFGNLRRFKLRAWKSAWFGGIYQRQGRYERAFVRWCHRHGHLCIRTVDLFWALAYHIHYGVPTFTAREVRKDWERRKWVRKGLLEAKREGEFFVVRPNVTLGLRQFYVDTSSKRRLAKYIDQCHRDPGPWRDYCRSKRAYFAREFARYQSALAFWRACGSQMRRDFLSCARYSHRLPEAHPDYLVHFRTGFAKAPAYGFVEVKGPRESLRPSQKRFFPELVTKAGQRVWVARVESVKRIRFARFNPKGELRSCSLLYTTSHPSGLFDRFKPRYPTTTVLLDWQRCMV